MFENNDEKQENKNKWKVFNKKIRVKGENNITNENKT